MNQNAKELYDDLVAERLQNFDMSDWGSGVDDCGSPRCIGGEASFRMGLGGLNGALCLTDCPNFFMAGEWLGLHPKVAHDLFLPGEKHGQVEGTPWGFGRFVDRVLRNSPYSATQKEAAIALKRACAITAALELYK